MSNDGDRKKARGLVMERTGLSWYDAQALLWDLGRLGFLLLEKGQTSKATEALSRVHGDLDDLQTIDAALRSQERYINNLIEVGRALVMAISSFGGQGFIRAWSNANMMFAKFSGELRDGFLTDPKNLDAIECKARTDGDS